MIPSVPVMIQIQEKIEQYSTTRLPDTAPDVKTIPVCGPADRWETQDWQERRCPESSVPPVSRMARRFGLSLEDSAGTVVQIAKQKYV